MVYTTRIGILSVLLSAFYSLSLCATGEFSHVYVHRLPVYYAQDSYIWPQPHTESFDELILSWNGERPKTGSFTFYARVHYDNTWSAWQKIFQWGKGVQRSFVNARHQVVHAKHTRFELAGSKKGNGFALKVVAHNGACLDDLHSLVVSTSDQDRFSSRSLGALKSVVVKNVPKQSQMVLSHQRKYDLCSPTSLAIVLSYWRARMKFPFKGSSELSRLCLQVAGQVRDQCYLDIFGNWVLNTAHVYGASSGQLIAWVQRLDSFKKLHEYLSSRIPVIVSIRGPLPGAAYPYKNGHLMVVVGYDARAKKVICIDPAFKSNEQTYVRYHLDDFLKAWGRSRNMSYIISPLS